MTDTAKRPEYGDFLTIEIQVSQVCSCRAHSEYKVATITRIQKSHSKVKVSSVLITLQLNMCLPIFSSSCVYFFTPLCTYAGFCPLADTCRETDNIKLLVYVYAYNDCQRTRDIAGKDLRSCKSAQDIQCVIRHVRCGQAHGWCSISTHRHKLETAYFACNNYMPQISIYMIKACQLLEDCRELQEGGREHVLISDKNANTDKVRQHYM